jgi:hypothetical protein
MDLGEGASIAASVVSAVAAVIGTYVSVAQWNATRSTTPAATTPPRPTPRPPRSGRLRRAALLVVLLGTVSCALFATLILLVEVGDAEGDFIPLQAVIAATLGGTVLVGVPVAIGALALGRFADLRNAVIGIAIALAPWSSLLVLAD